MKHVTTNVNLATSSHDSGASDVLDARALTVMVVEDDHDLLQLYAMQMADWSTNVDVHPFVSACPALMAMERIRPDLLVMDLDMPEIDGFEMLQEIRENPRLADLVVIVATGLSPQEITRRGGLPSYIPVLTKPISLEQLEQMARGVLIAKSRHTHPGKSR